MSYIYVLEHFGGGQHIDVDWSPIFEELYSLELDLRILYDQCAFFVLSLLGLSDAPTCSMYT